MRKSKFTDSQIMEAVKRIEAGFGVPDIYREMGISTATFYKWRAKYGGMDVSMMSRMKELEEENRRLKKMYLEEKLKAEIVSEAQPEGFQKEPQACLKGLQGVGAELEDQTSQAIDSREARSFDSAIGNQSGLVNGLYA